MSSLYWMVHRAVCTYRFGVTNRTSHADRKHVTAAPYVGCMLSSVTSVVLVGAEPRLVEVEAYVGGGQPRFSIVGLPDTAVREATKRVQAAIVASEYGFPQRNVIVNLAPADLPKGGSAYDLPIALAVLVASRQVPKEVADAVALGELALDGVVRPARGGLGAALIAARQDLPCLLAPGSAAEASTLGDDGRIVAVDKLAQAVGVMKGECLGSPIPPLTSESAAAPDLAEVRGQAMARRALEIAAAGGHHLLMTWSPGAGKTMLARCLPSILPRLSTRDVGEVALTWAAAGLARPDPQIAPFRSPHHSASLAALIGGGSGIPVPGETSLAHKGVLFLDELGEFPVNLLDSLRQPVEDGHVVVSRKGASVKFATEFQLVAASNPCPCGYEGDRLRQCECPPGAIAKYRRRLSGPLLDRFDLVVRVPRVTSDEMAGSPGESSECVAARVSEARQRQESRGCRNGRLARPQLDELSWAPAATAMLESAMRRSTLTARGWDRVRRVAASVADLAASDVIGEPHVAEALAYRGQS